MISKGKVRQAAIKPTLRQKVWNYMRRNRIFILSDVMAITDASYKNIREMMKIYELAGYVQVLNRGKPFTSTQLKLVKYTGVKAPSFDKEKYILFDYNTEEEIEINYISSLEKVVDCLNVGLVTKPDIKEKTKLSMKSLADAYSVLEDKCILKKVQPIKRNKQGHIYYQVDVEKATKLKTEFERKREQKRASVVPRRAKVIQAPSEKLIRLLENMTETKTTRRALDRKAGLRDGVAKYYWEKLIKWGVVSEINPQIKEQKGIVYRVSINKAKALKEKLLNGEKL